jgi:PEGA domain
LALVTTAEAPPLEAATATVAVTGPTENPTAPDSGDGLNAFAAEKVPPAKTNRWSPAKARPLMNGAAVAVIGIAIGAGAAVAYQKWSSRTRPAQLTIETVPSGLEISIDGQSRGLTPLTLTLPPRAYDAVVGSGTDQRVIKTSLAPGARMVQRLEVTASPAPAASGVLLVETVPPALPIKVDGINQGISPLTLQNVAPGEHDIMLANGRETLHRKVNVRGGETVSLLLTTAGAGPSSIAAGWLTFDAPVPLQIRESGNLLGSTESDRLMIAAGNHTLDFVNPDLGFSQRLTVNVTSGKTSGVQIKVPNGTLSLNAQPWAQVWVDGTRVGETPIGNLVRPIGRHEVVFRHPELGERRETVMVTTLQPTRLGVDLRRKSQ